MIKTLLTLEYQIKLCSYLLAATMSLGTKWSKLPELHGRKLSWKDSA